MSESTLDSYKEWYSATESNLLAEVIGQTDKAVESIYTLGYLHSTDAVPVLLDRISFSEHAIRYFIDGDGDRMSFGLAEKSPGWVYPSLVSLESLKPTMNEYLSRIHAETNNTLNVDLLSQSAYSIYGTNFLTRISDLLSSDSNRWSYVQRHLQWKSFSFTKPIHFGNPSKLALPSIVSVYESTQSNLLSLALSSCREENQTALVDIVSTYRFIHAPIPEAVSTNVFFRTTIGGE